MYPPAPPSAWRFTLRKKLIHWQAPFDGVPWMAVVPPLVSAMVSMKNCVAGGDPSEFTSVMPPVNVSAASISDDSGTPGSGAVQGCPGPAWTPTTAAVADELMSP